RKRDEVVEVDPIAPRHRARIGRSRLRCLGASPALRSLLPRDGAQQPLRLVRAESECLGEQRDALGLARDPEARTEAGRAPMLAQDGEAERMEGVNGDLVRAGGEQACKA